MTDQLAQFSNIVSCPDCGSLSTSGLLRCHECGLFYYNLDELPERDPPPVEEIVVDKPDLDPSLYSLNPLADLPENTEEEPPDPTIDWFDASTDFNFEAVPEKSSLDSGVDVNE